MNSLSILYIGRNSGTSRHRALALGRLGHNVFHIDPYEFIPKWPAMGMWIWQTGALFLEGYVHRCVLAGISQRDFDLVFVDGVELMGPALVQDLKRKYGTVVNYNIDDPFGKRDGRRWRLYLRAVPFYDLVVVLRDCNVPEAFAAGAKKVLRVRMSADEIAHAPRILKEEDHVRWNSQVAFVGTWMPERGPFLARLVELGVPLAIYGDRWHKAREFSVLRPHWRKAGLYDDDTYAKAIQCAHVNLGLLSKGNRDLSTTRSFEIPSLGGVLCAERTSEHAELYRENHEAVFWDTPEECAQKCLQLLQDHDHRRNLAVNGRNRCLQNYTTNEHVLAQVLHEVERPLRAPVDVIDTDSRVSRGLKQTVFSSLANV
jgi:spore maturation protein CgeB